MRIMFVCQGNIIRSPLAENLLRQMAAEKGLEDRFQLDSAGTSAYHVGEPPDRRMRETAKKIPPARESGRHQGRGLSE